jgi:hypothetical protein
MTKFGQEEVHQLRFRIWKLGEYNESAVAIAGGMSAFLRRVALYRQEIFQQTNQSNIKRVISNI